jgi:preprotein translocase subunit SecD
MTAAAMPLIAAALVGACEPAGTGATPQASGEHAYTICPPSGELPPNAINDRAVEILDARLVALGVETSSIGVGAACIDVTASTTSATQDAAVRAAVLGTGTITLVAARADGQTTSVGLAPPDGVVPVLSGTDFRSAMVVEPSPGAPALGIAFSDAGSATIASWSRLHPGELTALVVDGVVVALPEPNGLLTDGMNVSLGETPPVPLEALAAMINTGPLPPEWAQPRVPQG